MRKRVLYIIGNLYSGGVESITSAIFENISKEKFEIDLAVNSIDKSSVFYNSLNNNVSKMYVYGINKDCRTILLSSFKLWNIIKNGNYDIVHSNINFLNSIILMLAYFAKIKKRISHSHCSMSENEKKMLSKRLKHLIRCVLRPIITIFATDKWAVSKMAGEWLYGLNQKFKIVNNGIEPDKYKYDRVLYSQKRKKLNIENKFVISNIGSFEVSKNHRFLFDVFEKISKIKTESVLLLAGNGHMENELKKYASAKNMNKRIKFLGIRNDIADILQISDTFIFPSISEGFGLAVLEAQAAGLPCFISDQIPKEINIMNTFVLPLNAGAEYWANIIIEKTQDFTREDCSVRIKDSKFDIKQIVANIQESYFNQ